MNGRGPSVVVVGAGIVGASLAYRLARAGAAVTLVDGARPASGATARSFAWINVAHRVASGNVGLRSLAIGEYRRLERELGGALSVDRRGALAWSSDPAAAERTVAGNAAWGLDARLVETREIAALEPNLIAPPSAAAYAPSEGAIDPVAATRALVAAARERGARAIVQDGAVGLMSDGGRIAGVRLGTGPVPADVVAVAAGVGSTALCAGIGLDLPVSSSPATLLRFRAPSGLVTRVVSNDDLEIRESRGGRLLAAGERAEGAARDALGERVLAALRRQFRGAGDARLLGVETGRRPMPADGAPIVGFAPSAPNLYLAVMHSGIVLAPVVGRLAAGEILGGVEAGALASCRLSRFDDPSAANPP